MADRTWIGIGGGALVLYGGADATLAVISHADRLRAQPGLWTLILPLCLAVLGLLFGFGAGRAAASRAFAPFLRALPLSHALRLRMVALAVMVAALFCGLLLFGLLAGVCRLIDKPQAAAAGAALALVFELGCAIGLACRLRLLASLGETASIGRSRGAGAGIQLASIRGLDGSRPAWIGSWAWNLEGGRIRLTGRVALALVGFAILGGWSIGASLARHQAAPAALAGTGGGLALFMLSLRYRPLASPVLRTLPLGFTRAWLRLVALPLAVSVGFFLPLAGAALAAEPSAWPVPAEGSVALLVLSGIYAVFAAHFAAAPLLGAAAFLAALAYANYEAIEYGDTVYLALAALVAWLWHRTRERFRIGRS